MLQAQKNDVGLHCALRIPPMVLKARLEIDGTYIGGWTVILR